MRKTLFWIHLIMGTVAGIVVLIMSVTGVLLMYERQMLAWADRGFRVTPSAAQEKPEPSALLQRIADSERAAPDSLTLRSDPSAPAEAVFGRRTVYVDPYTGRVLGEGAKGMRSFFRTVTDWHRWLAMTGDNRQLGRAITGYSNLLFLFLVLTGMYIWLPRRWSWPQFRAVLFFRPRLAGKARDFNWHNVIGIWSAVPLFFVVLGALVISFPWATNLIYRITGNEPPAAARPNAPAEPHAASGDLSGLSSAWKTAQATVPAWESITFRVPGSARAPYTFAIAESHRGRPDKRSTLTVDRASLQPLKHETFAGYNTGRQWRMWLRFIHTGEALGWIGQTIAGLVSAGAVVLVWTGLALCWRRFRAWRTRRREPRQVEELQEVR